MRFDGEWLQCDDGIVRPVVRAEIAGGGGSWRAIELLVDTGADRTVLSANVLASLGLPTIGTIDQIGGVGGLAESVMVETQIRLTRSDGQKANFKGKYVACAEYQALDISVLGRDILDLFTLIVDRRSNIVAIIGGRHRFLIQDR